MSLDHCASLVEAGDPDRFLSAMTAPPEGRARLLPLYALNLEIARAAWVAREPMIGLMRLQFWEDAVREIAAGGRPRPQPVLDAAAPLLRELPAGPFLALIEARRADVSGEPPATPAAFEAYVAATSANLMVLAARVLGAEADRAAADLGHAMGVANLFRALPGLAARGRLPLPGLAPQDRAALAAGRTTPALAAALAAIGAAARSRLAEGRAAARTAPRTARPALRAAWRAPYLLARVHPGVDVCRDLGPESEARRRWGLLWRSLLGAV